ncbi:uncharacterized protein [Palaemon carinicauda]|uniref:uncharacterized protein n=1 Tax=Palaemon carinicauda TaxID=392227 RepID=UPI0035B639A5
MTDKHTFTKRRKIPDDQVKTDNHAMTNTQPLQRFSGFLDLNRLGVEDTHGQTSINPLHQMLHHHPPHPSHPLQHQYPHHPIRCQRRRSWNKPALIRKGRQVRSVSVSDALTEQDVSQVNLNSVESPDILCGTPTSSGSSGELYDVFPEVFEGHSSGGSGDGGSEGAEALPFEYQTNTRRQESVTYEESIPVIVRRRGCTLTVRIVSVEDIELPGTSREAKVSVGVSGALSADKAVKTSLSQKPKSFSTLSLPQLEYGSGGVGTPLSPTVRRSVDESSLWRRRTGCPTLGVTARQASTEELRRRRESFASLSPHHLSAGSIYHAAGKEQWDWVEGRISGKN